MEELTFKKIQEHAGAIKELFIKEHEENKESTANCLVLFNSGDEHSLFVFGRPIDLAASVAMACHEKEELKPIFTMGIFSSRP